MFAGNVPRVPTRPRGIVDAFARSIGVGNVVYASLLTVLLFALFVGVLMKFTEHSSYINTANDEISTRLGYCENVTAMTTNAIGCCDGDPPIHPARVRTPTK